MTLMKSSLKAELGLCKILHASRTVVQGFCVSSLGFLVLKLVLLGLDLSTYEG
jgi:hypothetical protein